MVRDGAAWGVTNRRHDHAPNRRLALAQKYVKMASYAARTDRDRKKVSAAGFVQSKARMSGWSSKQWFCLDQINNI